MLDNMASADNPQLRADHEKAAVKENVAQLNNHFREGGSVWEEETLGRIREFERPIIFDLNNVLVNTKPPYESNPQALDTLNVARSVGNIFIITSAGGWEEQQTELQRLGLWDNDIVLMMGNNSIPPEMDEESMSSTGRHRFWRPQSETPAFEKAVTDFIELAKQRGIECKPEDFRKTPSWKRVAPIFLKNFDIPLMDDRPEAFQKNPGIFGIGVPNWEITDISDQSSLIDEFGSITLLGTVGQVKNYYESQKETEDPLKEARAVQDTVEKE